MNSNAAALKDFHAARNISDDVVVAFKGVLKNKYKTVKVPTAIMEVEKAG